VTKWHVTGKVGPDIVNGEAVECDRLSVHNEHGSLRVILAR